MSEILCFFLLDKALIVYFKILKILIEKRKKAQEK